MLIHYIGHNKFSTFFLAKIVRGFDVSNFVCKLHQHCNEFSRTTMLHTCVHVGRVLYHLIFQVLCIIHRAASEQLHAQSRACVMMGTFSPRPCVQPNYANEQKWRCRPLMHVLGAHCAKTPLILGPVSHVWITRLWQSFWIFAEIILYFHHAPVCHEENTCNDKRYTILFSR